VRTKQLFQLTKIHLYVSNSFDIKSAQLPLMALLLKKDKVQQTSQELLQTYGPGSDSADFFEGDAVIIDCQKLTTALTAEDLQSLTKALLACKLKPVALRSARPEDQRLAGIFNLVVANEEPVIAKPTRPQTVVPVEVVKEVVREVVHEVRGPSTMIVDKPVRSGQKIYARGADLVVLAMVNPGGEVVADGNIHVYAPLRGKAMAGASGNTKARIFSTCLEPELISIAGVYRTSENSLPTAIQGKLAQVRLSDDGQENLLFEAVSS